MRAADRSTRSTRSLQHLQHLQHITNTRRYVHRVGRTARAGRRGTSYTLLRDAEVHHFKHSMAKAGKAWRPLSLPRQAQEIGGMEEEYARALTRLQRALEMERAGALPRSATREAVGRALDGDDAEEAEEGAD